MSDNTRDKEVWKGIIGVTWEASEKAFYETLRKRNCSLPLTSSQQLPGRGAVLGHSRKV
jgi:hypothetical protein